MGFYTDFQWFSKVSEGFDRVQKEFKNLQRQFYEGKNEENGKQSFMEKKGKQMKVIFREEERNRQGFWSSLSHGIFSRILSF